MREGIHPEYFDVDVRCACGATWKTRSTKKELRLEICSNCHPFFTGKQKLIDTEGRVERFMKKYGALAEIPPEKQDFHILKHSICTHLLDAGEELYFVKDWVGHKNIQNTLVYARLTTATMDARARKVFASHLVV